MKFKELEKLIKDDGWYWVSTVGSHFYYQHPTKPGKVTIPNHKGDVTKGTQIPFLTVRLEIKPATLHRKG